MSTSTISLGVATRILKNHGALVLTGALVLFVGASCSTAKVAAEPTGGGQSQGGKAGKGGGGNGGGQGSNSGCDLCGSGGGPGPTTAGINVKNCGNGKLDTGEGCDDSNPNNGDGCNHLCQIEAGWLCPDIGKPCVDQRICGNGKLTSDEACDDFNTKDGDGCSADCKTVEDGYQCRQPGKPCVPLCGDGKKIGSETCDDGNNVSGDGCSSTCQVEPGADCPEVGKPCVISECGNGKVETGELCDAGKDKNGLFYGDGKGCSKTCTKEPSCRDSSGHNRACDTTCGDGNVDPGEDCDDGNLIDNDGCSSSCKIETDKGFTCSKKLLDDASACKSGTGKCLELPVVYRDFLPQNVAGGHPDFYYLGAKNGNKVVTWCVPNSGGPAKGQDSTARCWDIAKADLLNGKPQFNDARTNGTKCDCQFSDWSRNGNGGHVPGYLDSESPLWDPSQTPPNFMTPMTGWTSSGGPIWHGMVDIMSTKANFDQWFNDDKSVNTTFTGVLEMQQVAASNIYQFSSPALITPPLLSGGFFPLDTLNATQTTLCNLWPYWHNWPTCAGDQYLFPPRITGANCNPAVATLAAGAGCWVTTLTGVKHDNWFTDEARYYFRYDGGTGLTLQFYGDDDLFIFINGKLVVDLGGVHQQLPGKVTVMGESPLASQATIIEGGCLDALGNIATCPTLAAPTPAPSSPADFRNRTMDLGLKTGSIYEIAIFGADRHPPESNYQLSLSGFTVERSICQPRCGDGKVSAGEECDCGDDDLAETPAGCSGKNNDTLYGGCKKDCTWGPFCGDGNTDKPEEQCDKGKDNGSDLGKGGCTFGCMSPHFCGDGFTDTDLKEECDMGDLNGKNLDTNGKPTDDGTGMVQCNPDCTIPPWMW
jgi:fibro-slime domain-containing protein